MKLVGAVIAGGASRRMGSDKALLPLPAGPLWRRQLQVLRAAGARPAAVVRQPGQPALGPTCWRDQRAGCGPLAGLETALARVPAGGWLAALAVDMPLIGADWFQYLLARIAPALPAAPAHGAVGMHGGLFEPLAAIYPVAALAEVRSRLDSGDLALQRLIGALIDQKLMRTVPVPSAFLPALRSVNTVKEWRSTTVTSASPPRGRDSTN